jgi:hypothetical protein
MHYSTTSMLSCLTVPVFVNHCPKSKTNKEPVKPTNEKYNHTNYYIYRQNGYVLMSVCMNTYLNNAQT